MDRSIITFIVLSLYVLPSFSLQCKFGFGPHTYDICPLIFAAGDSSAGRVMRIHQDGELPSPAKPSIVYDINLGGDGLYLDTSLPAFQQCPEGTWICMKMLSTSAELNGSLITTEVVQALPLAGNIQYDGFHGRVDAEAHLTIPDEEFGIPSIDIILNGGYYLSQPQRVKLLFICDESHATTSNSDPTLPTVTDSTPTPLTQDASEVYTHVFTWRSQYACPSQVEAASSHPLTHWWSSFSTVEAPDEEETSGLRPNKGKTVGIIIGSLAGACVLLSGVYYLHSRRHSKAYDAPSLQELFRQWLTSSASYLQQIPWSSVSFSPIRTFVTKPFSRNRSGRRYRYNPLFAEEYEIQDREEENNSVLDLQAQETAPRIKASRGSMGYGSI